MDVLRSNDKKERIPPKGDRVPGKDIEILRQWIEGGLKWEPGFTFGKEAYEPRLEPRKPELPPAVDGRRHPVDRLIDAHFKKHKLTHPKPLGDAAFMRRLSLDLLGLLPESAEVDAFVKRKAPDKRGKLIAMLIRGLEERGMLDRTLVIIASEFSRDMLIEGVPGSTARDQSRAKSDTLELPKPTACAATSPDDLRW